MIGRSDEAILERLRATATPLAILRHTAAARPEHPALVFLPDATDGAGRSVTYRELLHQVESAAAALADTGVGPDEAVALLMPSMPEGVAAFIAATAVGVAFPVNLLLTTEALAAQLALARARVVIALGRHPAFDLRARAVAAASQAGGVHTVVEVPTQLGAESALSWDQFIGKAARVAARSEAPDRIGALFHTGGSTGTPKLAELTLRNVAAGALMSAAATAMRAEDRVLCGLPLFHVAGAIDVILGAIAVGATVILPTVTSTRNPQVLQRIWQIVDETRATILGLVPTSLAAVADVPRLATTLQTLRVVATGGSSCAPQLARRIEAVTGCPVAQVYGMTEASGIIAAQPFDGEFRAPAVGFAAPLLEMRLGGGDGTSGEVHWRGPNVFRGYRTPAGTEGAASQWVASGDLGELGTDGQLRLLGRTKDVIIRSGHNIDPLLIEDVAQEHQDVRQAAAVPLPDAYAGEVPVLYVALRAGATSDAASLVEFVAARIAEPPAKPKAVFILPELPLTPLGKIARYKLRQLAAAAKAVEALRDLPVEQISCADPVAKRIDLTWRATASALERERATAILATLGLTASA